MPHTQNNLSKKCSDPEEDELAGYPKVHIVSSLFLTIAALLYVHWKGLAIPQEFVMLGVLGLYTFCLISKNAIKQIFSRRRVRQK